MPVHTPTPPDAAPGPTRRWEHPELTSHAALALTDNRIRLAPLGSNPDADAVAIDLAAVRRVELDLLANAVVVEYAADTRTTRERVAFATPEAADACFMKIWRRVGDELRLAPHRRAAWARVRPPLVLLFGSLLATAVLVLARSIAQDEAPGGAFWWPDWRLVCALGGAVAAVSQVWLYRRLTVPPVALELVRA